jgi:hypothetical protein
MYCSAEEPHHFNAPPASKNGAAHAHSLAYFVFCIYQNHQKTLLIS